MFLSQAWVCKGWTIREGKGERERRGERKGERERWRERERKRFVKKINVCVMCVSSKSFINKGNLKCCIRNLDCIFEKIIAL